MTLGPERAPGERIDAFEIVRHLASGGMADVYSARIVETGAPIVLKFLADHSPVATARFQREARIAMSLRHPGIVATLSSGITRDGVAYLAMELLEGADLETRLRRGGVLLTDVLAFAVQVCDALSYAHSRKVVHRDLKPSNLFLCEAPSGIIKILDFGIARVTDELPMTGTGGIVGTWAYMSPEQVRGDRDIDPRTDLWSLGVLLYECIAARVPFKSESGTGTLVQILLEEPVPLAKLCAGLPTSLTSLVDRTLVKAREGRPASAAAMRASLASALADVRGSSPGLLVPILTGPAAESGVPATRIPATRGHERTQVADVENRLSSVVFLRGPRDRILVDRVAGELHGRAMPLPGGDTLVHFGLDRWAGDEPLRAIRLSLAVRPSVSGIGIATGRVTRGESHVSGGAVESAVKLAAGDGVRIDASTALAVGDDYVLVNESADCFRVEPRASRPGARPSRAAPGGLFVGRAAEISMLRQSVDKAASELRPQVIVTLGPAGIGKTRLAFEAIEQLSMTRSDLTVLHARCDLFGRDTPFATLREALGEVIEPAMAAMFVPQNDEPCDPAAALDRVHAGLETLLRGLADRGPIVLVVDQAQWLDAASRDAIRWLCDAGPDLPIAVWVFARPEVRDTFTGLAPSPTVFELGPLMQSEAARLLDAIVPNAPAELLNLAGGNPLYLEELARLHAEKGQRAPSLGTMPLPVSIEGAVLAQIDVLDPSEREFLKCAAIFGQTFWQEAVSALDGDATAVPRLRRANVILPRTQSRVPAAREFSFRIGITREVLYALWPASQLARMHARAAQWLSTQQGIGASELAQHWELGERPEEAGAAYAAAASASALVADTATAVAHAARALALASDPEVRWRALTARAYVLQYSGQPDVQRAGLAEMSTLAMGLSLRHRVECAWREAYYARLASDRATALAAGQRAIELGDVLGAPFWRAAARDEAAMCLADDGRLDEARAYSSEARQLSETIADPWLAARTISTAGYIAGEGGQLIEALELFERSAQAWESAGDRRRQSLARANAGWIMVQLGRVAEAGVEIRAALEGARRVGNQRTEAVALHNLGIVERMSGNVDAARALQSQARELGQVIRHERLLSYIATEHVYLALASAAPTDARRAAADAAEQIASNLVSRAVTDSTRAAVLRARAPDNTEDEIASARASIASALSPEARAEIAVAVYDAGGRRDDDLAAARLALEECSARVSDDARAAFRMSLCRRFLMPREISEA